MFLCGCVVCVLLLYLPYPSHSGCRRPRIRTFQSLGWLRQHTGPRSQQSPGSCRSPCWSRPSWSYPCSWVGEGERERKKNINTLKCRPLMYAFINSRLFWKHVLVLLNKYVITYLILIWNKYRVIKVIYMFGIIKSPSNSFWPLIVRILNKKKHLV